MEKEIYKYKINDYRDSYKNYNIEITVTNNVLTKVHCNCNKFKVINTEQKTIPEYNKIYEGIVHETR